jgi:putative protease
MSDPGMIQYVRDNFTRQQIHLSVQANCTNWTSAEFWHRMGITRIILSRELHIKEIKQIHEKVPAVELEVFVHGAMCMAYSGRCLLSNYMAFRDSNQGVCANSCRHKYSLYSSNRPQADDYVPLQGDFYLKESEGADTGLFILDEDQYGTYILNAKDICAIEQLEDLVNAGVASFKIEGRTRSLYYVTQTVRSYRGAVDDMQKPGPLNSEHVQNVQKLDSRGYAPGFLVSRNRELLQNYTATHVRSETAQVAAFVKSYDAAAGKAIISVKGPVGEGDPLEVVTPEGNRIIKALGLQNHKGETVARLSPGLKNCRLDLDEDPGKFCLLISLKK